ncbi:MAG: single-stranded-DNA-specific exonuclease RecJ [Negativicutes bacterium]|nr:single-stranded-DNA-specific exonuclease RecJ [Negativicutes bacterium]
MVTQRKAWRLLPAKKELCEQLCAELGVLPVVARVLVNRGIVTKEDAERFLYAGAENLGNPYALKDMERAVERIVKAIDEQEKIVVYGDYDVDGITASAVLFRLLTRLGARVDYYIPERQSEGYGLNSAALSQLYDAGARLIVTVDCGISSREETANMLGKLDIIITDHHEPSPELPPAYAVINPKRPDCSYPDKQLAGVGVVFKLCQALWQRCKGGGQAYLEDIELVAIGTIADIVPLTGENRLMAKLGLEKLTRTVNHGLKSLMETCLQTAKPDAGKVGYILAPRLNAAGRIGHAANAVELLTTSDPVRAKQLAQSLEAENYQRQAMEKRILEAAEQEIVEARLINDKVLIVAGEDWHPGVIGIVASRLVDKYYRPAIVISLHDGVGKGSCRSIPGFDMFEALSACAGLLSKYGGHKQAAGLTTPAANIPLLRRFMCQKAAQLAEEDFKPVLRIDTLVSLEQINAALLEQLACLAPYGTGNPAPILACRDLKVSDLRTVGQDGKHLKLRVRRQNLTGEVIAWGMGEMAAALSRDESIDVVFEPEFNIWQGQRSIQLKAFDLRKTKE